MSLTYDILRKNFNKSVPNELALPEALHKITRIGDADAAMEVTTSEDLKTVTEISITTFDDKIETTFYKLFVDGLEGGMGWSSVNFYQAAMATLKDHQAHTGTNSQGISAVHSWADNQMTVTIDLN
ncbi:hypothetical protein [Pseudolactococcus insecticola]|uniref:Uncharacterized protein n=1 Tax=Pseudolactococcus insecticola TaxID=2709158 RepID=A0A6A0B8S1_9LACT|nr:hypothetical protein [Lactococcus insecticola]GFH41236.1 hypothetical protein Hs20B_16340 [Lactococcus insecticola]